MSSLQKHWRKRAEQVLPGSKVGQGEGEGQGGERERDKEEKGPKQCMHI
jgi:hypothetical protein